MRISSVSPIKAEAACCIHSLVPSAKQTLIIQQNNHSSVRNLNLQHQLLKAQVFNVLPHLSQMQTNLSSPAQHILTQSARSVPWPG